tara:strand:- start:30 stop:332 length:303 start_codon:yes stop_codon:yes gene_type:complete
MLGLIFIYFVGRAFYRLAEEHQKSKWLWAVLGVVFYYTFGFIIGIIVALVNFNWAIQNEIVLSFIGIGVGIGGTIIIYHLLKRHWENKPTPTTDIEILDQ